MKFNTVKSKVLLFLSILTLLGTIFCIVSCDNFLSQNYGKTTININLDLSKLIKNSRNDDTQINGYVLKLFVYDAKNYQEGDKEIEKLPLLTQTSNKVDISGTVKASLEVTIDSTVIFVGKLFTLNENDVESDKPLYAGKSEVFKVQPKDNKVHLVLSRDKAEIGFEIELAETHTHKFADSWSASLTHHWKVTTCGHNDVMADFKEHSFGGWEITNATEDAEGSKERTCSVCNYKEVVEIAKLAHTHKFADSWTPSLTHHWKEANCGHTENVTGFGEHSFVDEVCTVCTYTTIPTGFVLIKGGIFQMGSAVGNQDAKPVHEVNLTKNFYMSKYEVTQGEYEKYCGYGGTSPSSGYGDGDNYPAYYVSWYDALVYCNKRSIDEGLTPCYSINGEKDPTEWGIVPTESNSTSWDAVVCEWGANGYRLPTEAEWEYAARAGDDTTSSKTYSGTSDVTELDEYAWYTDNSGNTTHIVGQRSPNAFDLYDMSGNVSEWCWNFYTGEYDETTEGGIDPTGALSRSYRVRRGGSWYNDSDYCAVSFRGNHDPYYRGNGLGFRVVRASSK